MLDTQRMPSANATLGLHQKKKERGMGEVAVGGHLNAPSI